MTVTPVLGRPWRTKDTMYGDGSTAVNAMESRDGRAWNCWLASRVGRIKDEES